jgi:hypothetical protein
MPSANPKRRQWKFMNLNPNSPSIRSLIKIHKTEKLIRPIINWMNAPAYKISKFLTKIIDDFVQLPFTYNVQNTINLMNDLKEIVYGNQIKLASLDKCIMYTNILTKELIDITKERMNTTI